MNLDAIQAALDEALPLRSPVYDPTKHPRERIVEMEAHMLKAAHVAGSLYEAKHWLLALEARLRDEWETLTGWDYALTRPRGKATKAEIDQAKAQAAPALFESGRRARHLRESVIDQIQRLEKEGDRMSRAYSMEAGS